jgi:two-component system, NtrC family, sensor histidine kinase HydH
MSHPAGAQFRRCLSAADRSPDGPGAGTTLALLLEGGVRREVHRAQCHLAGVRVRTKDIDLVLEAGLSHGTGARHIHAVRSRNLIPLVGLLVAAVLALGVAGLRYERNRLMGDFGGTQQDTARQLVADLEKELAELDDDGRLVTMVLSRARSRPSLDAAEEDSFLLAGFQALATVVRHYRAIYLFRRGAVAVRAIDPAETASVAQAFLGWSVSAAQEASKTKEPVFYGPREGPDGRQFFIYARSAGSAEAVVLVSEARYLLEPVLRSRSPSVHYLLVDPGGSIWVGCWESATCRAFTRNEWPSIPGLAALMEAVREPQGQIWNDELVPAAVGLPSRPAAIAWSSTERGRQRWTMVAVASAQSIEARERSLLWWLVVTSLALGTALTGVGAFIVRHQRRSVVLTERLRHAQDLADLRERTEKLVENVSAGLIGITAEGRVALTNRFLTERVAQVPIGASVFEVLSGGNSTAALQLSRTLAEALRAQRTQTIPADGLGLFAWRPGHFDIRVIPLNRPAQDVSALLLIEDLSELRSLEKQLVRAEKLVTVGILTAGLAHEIGTPLGIIRGRAELLLSKVKDPAIARDVESVVRQIDQITSTIRQVLDFARTQPVERKPVDVNKAVDAALSMLDWRFRQKALSVRIDLEPNVPRISADADQLQQVLVNLLLNACDACESGGSITVRVRLVGGASHVSIEIQDDGCGIAAEDLNAVFDPYFTTKKRGEGTGLGLPVAASIVRNHQGEIALRSQKGMGSTVAITWPVAMEEVQAHA